MLSEKPTARLDLPWSAATARPEAQLGISPAVLIGQKTRIQIA
jgi:hypothetical protein